MSKYLNLFFFNTPFFAGSSAKGVFKFCLFFFFKIIISITLFKFLFGLNPIFSDYIKPNTEYIRQELMQENTLTRAHFQKIVSATYLCYLIGLAILGVTYSHLLENPCEIEGSSPFIFYVPGTIIMNFDDFENIIEDSNSVYIQELIIFETTLFEPLSDTREINTSFYLLNGENETPLYWKDYNIQVNDENIFSNKNTLNTFQDKENIEHQRFINNLLHELKDFYFKTKRN